jgi:hypothetical protein
MGSADIIVSVCNADINVSVCSADISLLVCVVPSNGTNFYLIYQ